MERAAAIDRLEAGISRARRRWRQVIGAGLGLATIAIGSGFLAFAIEADRAWLDRHVLPYMFLSRQQLLLWFAIERVTAAILGIVILWPVRKWVMRQIGRGDGGALARRLALVGAACALSLLVSEWVLGSDTWGGVNRWAATEEPRRIADTYLGWRNAPGHIGRETYHGKRIVYYFDSTGCRLADRSVRLDARRPSILLTGESIMVGFRLNWPETVAGRLEAATRIQSVNLAVNGYATDQTFMRLSQELPRFARPLVVISLFAPALLERNLRKDRPHLDAALHWHPGRKEWQLEKIARNIFLYHSRAEIDDAIMRTSKVLRATVRAAQARHATALILVPAFTPEQPGEREIRRRVLDDAGLPYVYVPLDPQWRIAHDGHPDAQANRAMANALLKELTRRGVIQNRLGRPPSG